MKISFDEQAWADYQWWQAQDRRLLKRVNAIIEDIARNGNDFGIGKPEALKYSLRGYWSRRINDEHRIIYRVVDDEVQILVCRYHYE